ncbi:MAG: tRNA dihydrouridine synthase DusB [Proteobacteria bacterium]|nr:tRNA dihydrouridine synthase DusB [Pseudomonadota bacterium]MBU1738681.1 tRNA dihydrouridine synthase DusB [Pseudomonadota bacterium]
MKIQNLTLENPFILAPLAGYTDLPFRRLCREYGAALCYSEMISCHGLVYRQQNTIDMLQTVSAERPVAMQLFGGEPGVMGEAAAILSEYPVDIIDINMGCPVKKVIKKGAGASLIRQPKIAEEIIRSVCANSKHPVTVKTRTGWSHHEIVAVEFAQMVAEAGASALTLHARTWTDGFSGVVDWEMIGKVKEATSIPVIGNGDILCHDDGLKMLSETGCDGVMIGRAALGAPWIFSAKTNPLPSLHFRLKALSRHLELVEQYQPTESILGKMKNHAGKYFKGVLHGKSIREKIYATKSFAELKHLIQSLLDQNG